MARIPLRAYNREIADLIDHEQFDEAIAHCKHILMFFSKHIDTYRLLGKAYLESQRYGDAADVFQRVLSSLPEDFVAHLGMSVIREDEGNLDEAIWHMERAFEMQPANATVQGELRRLFGRRDGLEPPKVRLTRGALARMYVKGGLYPQAVAELRAALAEDPQRLDLLTLLARTYFLAGQKAEAADTSNALLRKLPNSLEANLLLSQILAGSERAAEAESYRQRVQELDPYTAYTSPDVTSPEASTPDKVQENLVTIERLDWKPGQPATETGAQPEWAASLGLNAKEMSSEEQVPEWLSNLTADMDEPEAGGEARKTVPSGAQSETPTDTGAKAFPSETPEPAPPPVTGEIPGWMAAVGWVAASGQAEEAGPVPAFEEEPSAEETAPTEMPDWLRSIAPSGVEDAAQDLPGDQEEQPPVSEPPPAGPFTKEFLPWLSETQPGPTDSILNWLEDKTPPPGIEPGPGETGSPEGTEEAAIPGWIQGTGEESFSQEESDAPIDLPDWLTGSEPDETGSDIPDWLKGLADQPETANEPEVESQTAADEFFQQASAAEEPAIEERQAWGSEAGGLPAATEGGAQSNAEDQPEGETPDWLKAIGLGAALSASRAEGEPAEPEPKGEESEEGAFDWLEGLADRQGAGAAIFPTSEEPLETSLDWMAEESPAGEGQSPAVENEAELPHAELPEWLQGLAPTTPLEPAGSDLGTVGIFPLAGSEEPAPSAEPADIPEWLQGITSEQGTSGATGEGAGFPGKLDEGPISEEDTKPTRVSQAMEVSIPPELSEFVAETTPEPAETQAPVEGSWEAVQEPTSQETVEPGAEAGLEEPRQAEAAPEEIPEWLQLTEEQPSAAQEEPASETPAWELSSVWAEVSPAVEAAPEAAAGEQDAAFDWLEDLGSPQAEETAGPTSGEIAAAVIGAHIFKAAHEEEPAEEIAGEEVEEAAPAGLGEQAGVEGPPEGPGEGHEPSAIYPAVIGAQAFVSSEAAAEGMEAETEVEPVSEEEVTAEGEIELPAWLDEEGGEAEAESPAEAAPEQEAPEEPTLETPAAEPEVISAELVDLNGAGLTDLERVPGIGLVGAQEILAYRETQGEFSTLEDLRNVPGFDEETILKLQDRLTVAPKAEAGIAETPVDWSQMALIQARNAVAQSSPEQAYGHYSVLIKSRTMLPEVIQDLHEALYRFPEDVPLLQALGDAYARNDQLQEALDTYTKAEELLR